MSLAPRPRLAPSVALTADGTTAITTWAERLGIAVWDVRTGKLRRTVCSDAAIHALAVSPTAGLVAAAGRWADSIGGAVAIVDLDTGDVLRSAPNALRLDGHLAFAPDGKLLVSWDGKSADLFEAATLRPVGSFRPRRGEFGAMAITPGGRLLAAEHQSWGANGMLTDGAVQPVDLVAGTPLGRLTGPPMLSTGMAFAPDGTRFAVGSGTSVLLWDLKRLPGAASPAATRVAAAELDRLWGDLAADDAGRAYRAVWTLAAAADQAVAYLAQRLRPAPEPPAVRLIRDLDSPTFAVRQQAATALRALGRDAEPAVRRALENGPSLELRRRAGPLLAELRRRVPEPERLRPLRAVQVLEYAGTEPARRVLEKLAAGAPDAELTREAKAALGRLARRLP